MNQSAYDLLDLLDLLNRLIITAPLSSFLLRIQTLFKLQLPIQKNKTIQKTSSIHQQPKKREKKKRTYIGFFIFFNSASDL
jgi:hypothetical protein